MYFSTIFAGSVNEYSFANIVEKFGNSDAISVNTRPLHLHNDILYYSLNFIHDLLNFLQYYERSSLRIFAAHIIHIILSLTLLFMKCFKLTVISDLFPFRRRQQNYYFLCTIAANTSGK